MNEARPMLLAAKIVQWLVSGNIRRMRILVVVPLGGGVKWQCGCRRR